MNEFLQSLINALNVLHYENMLILATMVDKDMSDPYIKMMDDAFNKAISPIVKKQDK